MSVEFPTSSELVACRDCRREVSVHAQMCPHCGAPFPARATWTGTGFEYKSKMTIAGLPLLHIAIGRNANRKLRVATGIIAIGQFARGIVAIGQFTVGVVSVGQVGLGFICLGQFALGALVLGQLAVGYTVLHSQIGLACTRDSHGLLLYYFQELFR